MLIGKYNNKFLTVVFFSIAFVFVLGCRSDKEQTAGPQTMGDEKNLMLENGINEAKPDESASVGTVSDSEPKLSDEELKSLKDLNVSMRDVRRTLSDELTKYINDQGFTREEFEQISQIPESELSAEQSEKVSKINQRMAHFQQDISMEMEKMVLAAGYTMEEFLQIARQISRDPEMRAKVERQDNN